MTHASRVAGKRRTMLVICPYPEGVAAPQRLKFEQYYDDWRARGWDLTISPFMDRAMWDVLYVPGHNRTKAVGTARGYARRLRDLARMRAFDAVFVHMWVTPFGGAGTERRARRQARRMIFDVEDNVIGTADAPQARNPNPLLRLLKGSAKPLYLAAAADHVIASSPSLAERCRELNARGAATYISSSVDTDRFVPAAPRAADAPVTIGWTGTFSTSAYLDLLRPAFLQLAERVPFKLRVIGNFDWSLPGVDLEVIRWSAQREVADLQALDIGVYPLPFDDWVGGKSGLKAIQYMAFGIPTVATNAGTTPRIIRDGENGLLVRTEAEWVDALERLVRDPDLRRRLGGAARRDAVERYSTKAVAADYRRVLDDVAGIDAIAERGGAPPGLLSPEPRTR